MKDLEWVIVHYRRGGFELHDLDCLREFVAEEDLHRIGVEIPSEDAGTHRPMKFTRRNVMEILEYEVEGGFYKALECRAISASARYRSVRLLNWILEEGLDSFDHYQFYGLPLFKATALKYGFPNPIGKDSGTEGKYK